MKKSKKLESLEAKSEELKAEVFKHRAAAATAKEEFLKVKQQIKEEIAKSETTKDE